MMKCQHRNIFTLIELLIVIAIIAILAALLLPALNRARDKSRTIQCISNQKQYSSAIQAYYGDFNHMPMNLTYTYSWCAILRNDRYVTNKDVFYCPIERAMKKMVSNDYNCTYGLNISISRYYTATGTFDAHAIRKMEKVKVTSQTCLGADGYSHYNSNGTYWWDIYVNANAMPNHIHQSRAAVAYFDGHVEAQKLIPVFGSSGAWNDTFVLFWYGIHLKDY